MFRTARLLSLLAAAALPVVPSHARPEDPPKVRVIVVVVLATTENNVVDPKLAALAREVQKRDESLVGFKLAATVCKSIPVGDANEFDLVEKQKLTVKVNKSRDAEGKLGLTISPPELGEITYSCACSKFFPVATPYRTAKGESLIVAVMAKPCNAGKKK
jgi:hypothetical protein